MQKLIFSFFALVSLLFLSGGLDAKAPEEWHYPLYLANQGYWHARIPLEIRNDAKLPVAGEPVRITIGKGIDKLDLAGVEAGAIRLTDSYGTELLFRITATDDRAVTEGSIHEESIFILPVTAGAGETVFYYIYFDNPDAWPAGTFLQGDPSTDHGKRNNIVFTPAGNSVKIAIKPVQYLSMRQNDDPQSWTEDGKWDMRVAIRIFNFSHMDKSRLPVYIRMDQVYQRLSFKGYDKESMILSGETSSKYFPLGNAIILDKNIPPLSENTIYAYFKSKTDHVSGKLSADVHDWCSDKRNLLKKHGDNQKPELADSSWSREISVVQGRTYMFGARIKCDDPENTSGIRINCLRSGKSETVRWFESNLVQGKCDWMFLSGSFRAPQGTDIARMTVSFSGKDPLLIKDLMMIEVLEGYAGSSNILQKYNFKEANIATWPVNSIVRVFREDIPPEKIPDASVSVACNETEPLQIAIRSPRAYKNVRVKIEAPVNKYGKKLDSLEAFLVGYVPVDYPSNYYERKVPYWYLRYPDEPAGSDGWAGLWPDPLLPLTEFNLQPDQTQPIWVELFIPEGTGEGNYSGKIMLYSGDDILKEIPWTVRVYGFTLPQRNGFGAVYDYRSPGEMPEPGPEQFRKDISADSLRNMYQAFMSKHKICSGEINPVPDVHYRNGKVEIDFTEYDKAASVYFDKLKNPFAYLPTRLFYLFGWAFPPAVKFGEKPYEGSYPYDDADRGSLRPEYIRAYQSVLREFWEHLKEKGWSDRYVLYLSDEPHNAENGKADIITQMKALCNMIHEVDRNIPIYVSTWWYRPEWDGYIDIWGLGFNGEGDYNRRITVEDLNHIISTGGRIWYTTDGNFCTDTPFTALERLLPWFGFKYGAEAYEFWGVNWLTLNPYVYGWHSYIFESQSPGVESWKRYPNGDGFIIYPGKPAGTGELAGSMRIKQVREGAEDYEYLTLLKHLLERADPANPGLPAAKESLDQALGMVKIPCSMGRYSTSILKSPDELLRLRGQIAESIEMCIRYQRPDK